MIAAAAIVVGIFSAHRSVGLAFHGLRAGLVALNENFISAFCRRPLLEHRAESQQLVGKQHKRNSRNAGDECREFPLAPIREDLLRRNIRRSFHSLRRHFKSPRDDYGKNKTERDEYDECAEHPLRRVEHRQRNPRNLD